MNVVSVVCQSIIDFDDRNDTNGQLKCLLQKELNGREGAMKTALNVLNKIMSLIS